MKSRILFVFLIVLLTACSNSLVHTWNIDKLEIIRENGKNSTYNNIGTITFNKNGTGNNNFHIIENDYADTASFKWEKSDDYILLKPTKNDDPSRVLKAWIMIKNSSKKQIWKSTNGKNDIQILELSRN